MLDFYTVRDDQAASVPGLNLALVGSSEQEEFEAAQAADVIEPHVDYCGNFRWSSEVVQRKLARLAKLAGKQFEKLASILQQAKAAEQGLLARGD